MQYFPRLRSDVTGMSFNQPEDATTKSELLFYLVTGRLPIGFAVVCPRTLR